MSALTRMMTVRVAKHSSTTAFDSASIGSTQFVEPEGEPGFMPKDTARIERDLYRGDNQEYASIRGPKSLDAMALTMLVRGISGNTSTAAFTATTSNDLALLLDCIFGAASTDPSGVGSTATAGVGATPNLTMTSGTNYPNGGMVLFPTTSTGAGFFAREIVSGGGTTTLVLDRQYTGTVANPTTIVRGAVWTLQSSTNMHTHLYIDAEGENWRRLYTGCMSGLDLDFSEGQAVKASMSWQSSDWTGPAKASPAFSAPTTGSHIVNLGSQFYIGDSKFLLKGAKLSLGYTMQARATTTGDNGMLGYVVTRKQPVLSGTLYVGSNAAFGELADLSGTPTIQSLQAVDTVAGGVPTTRDIALQVGTTGAQAMYLRIPAAEFSGSFGTENGVDVFNFEARARRHTSGSMLRLGLF